MTSVTTWWCGRPFERWLGCDTKCPCQLSLCARNRLFSHIALHKVCQGQTVINKPANSNSNKASVMWISAASIHISTRSCEDRKGFIVDEAIPLPGRPLLIMVYFSLALAIGYAQQRPCWREVRLPSLFLIFRSSPKHLLIF